MKPNIITDGLPKEVVIDDGKYQINWDFRIGMKFDEIMESEAPDIVKLEKLLALYYPKYPNNLEEAVEKMLWFYRGGKAEKKEEKKERYKRRPNRGPAFSFSQDAPYIYAAFKEQYGIDLLSREKLHWWKFLALFESLGEETKMAKIMYYRTVSTSGMSKDRRAFINEMKKAYKLDGGKKLTLEERNQQWKEYVKKRNQERTVK